jgi:hypothetical protein
MFYNTSPSQAHWIAAEYPYENPEKDQSDVVEGKLPVRCVPSILVQITHSAFPGNSFDGPFCQAIGWDCSV